MNKQSILRNADGAVVWSGELDDFLALSTVELEKLHEEHGTITYAREADETVVTVNRARSLTDTLQPGRYAHIVEAAQAGTTGKLDAATMAYYSRGGSYILATDGKWTDSGRPRDLLAITPLRMEGTRVHYLWPAVNPNLVAALRAALDG